MKLNECNGCYLRNDEGNCKLARHPDRACHDIRVAYQIGRLDKKEECWIPCSERLPRENQKVLVCLTDWETGDKEIDVTYRRDTNMWHGHGRYSVTNVAWMPLPDPYKGD